MSQPPRPAERIAKLLARAGVASRREIERMIAEGRIALNGEALTTPATLLKSLAGVTVDGDPVAAPAPARLFAFHKPSGLLTTERDPAGRRTIYDALPGDLPRVVPVGRLDLNTEGLLLLTTDGGLKRQLELPSSGVERSYRARAYGEISQAQLEELIEGIEIDGIRYGQIDANLERRTGANVWIELTLTEGKNREVRRVLEHLGLRVSRLIRTRYGPFLLGDLPFGEVVEIRQHDLVAFRKQLALPPEKRQATAPEAIVPAVNRAARRAEAAQEREVAEAERPQRRPAASKAAKPAREGPRRAGDARPSRPRAKTAEPPRSRATPVRGDGERPVRAADAAERPRSPARSRRPAEAERPRGRDRPAHVGDGGERRGTIRDGSQLRRRPDEPSDRRRPSARPDAARTDTERRPPRDRSTPAGRDGGERPRTVRSGPRDEGGAERARPPRGKPQPRPGDLVDRPRSAGPRGAAQGKPAGRPDRPRPGGAGPAPRGAGSGKPRRPGPTRPR